MNDAYAASDRKPPEFDTSVALNARVWNYWLGRQTLTRARRGPSRGA